MSKVWAIAVREYLAAVKTKGFVISLVLMPVLMAAGVFAGSLANKVGDASTRRVAVIDHTGGFVADAIERAVDAHNADLTNDAGRQVRPEFVLERIDAGTDQGETDAAKFELSQRVRDGELLAFVEVGRDLLEPKIDFAAAAEVMARRTGAAGDDGEEADGGGALDALDLDARLEQAGAVYGEGGVVRYASNQPTYTAFRELLDDALRETVPVERLRRAELPMATVTKAALLAGPPIVTTVGLYDRDAETGEVVEEARAGRIIEGFIVPAGLVMLMFLVILIGASPMTTNVIEEKQLRIAEVLLAGVRPFDLMLGKLLGGVGVALTLALVYAGGAWLAAGYYGLAGYVRPELIGWLAVFTTLATMLYGALFAAAGAAVTNVKEAQSLISPIMIFLVIPVAMFMPILQNPNGPLAVGLGFFPLTAPLVTMMRAAVPPGLPWWQPALAVVSGLAGVLAIVWAGGRVFRVGMLASGKAPTPKELLGWVIRG